MKQCVKKLTVWLLVATLACVTSGALAASVQVTAKVEGNTLTITVSGMEAEKQTTLMILEKEAAPEEVTSGEATPWYIGQMETDANGTYTYTFDIQGEPYGEYIAYAGGENMERGQSAVFVMGKADEYVNGESEVVKVSTRLTNSSGTTISSFSTGQTGYIVASVSGYDIEKGFTGGTLDFTMTSGLNVTPSAITNIVSGLEITSATKSGNKVTVAFAMSEEGPSEVSCDLIRIPVTASSAIANATFGAAVNADGIIALERPEGDKSILRAEVGTIAAFSVTASGGSGGGSGGGGSGGGGGGGGGGGVTTAAAKKITKFSFESLEPAAVGVIDDEDGTIVVEVPKGTDVTNLVPTVTFEGASITPESGEAQNFSNIVEYVVKGTDGKTKTYQVSVQESEEAAPDDPDETGQPFTDLPKDHWAYASIAELVEKNIVSGESVDNGIQIRPEDSITRQEAAKIVVAAIGVPVVENAEPDCTDAALVDGWAKPFVAAAIEHGVVNGYEDGSFQPAGQVTREELLAMIMRGFELGESDAELTFDDADLLQWSKGYVAKGVELNILTGYADNTFRGSNTITRAEAFTVLQRAMDAAQTNPTE